MEANKIYEINCAGRKYGIVYNGKFDPENGNLDAGRFGVCAGGYGKIKYMRVKFAPCVGYWPWLYKTMLKGTSAADIVEALVISNKLNTLTRECITVCEHVLKYGKTPR